MKPQRTAKSFPEIEAVRLVWLAIFVSVFSYLFYNRAGEILLYGDAVAHINIARRVFDSKTPGLLQLGTVWLPLPHLLILPFIIANKMWQSGLGGSIPSMAAFVLGTFGIFRLVRAAFSRDLQPDEETKSLSWLAAIFYAANPNLIYMQATAMGESLYLAFFIWTLVFFAEFLKGNEKSLRRSGWCLFAACLTRYDGWFLAAVLVCVALIDSTASRGKDGASPRRARLLLRFIVLAAAGPLLWFGYNAAVYRNPLEFANGPYSAKAIEQRTATVNPGKGNAFASASYFLKSAEIDVGDSGWLGRTWLALALIGSIAVFVQKKGRGALLLWVPLPFYAISIAYGSIPIFVPPWWPHALYNLRYGLQLLPAMSVFLPVAIAFLLRTVANFPQINPSWRPWSVLVSLIVSLIFVAASDVMIWRADPACYREAVGNSRGRITLDKRLAEWIKYLPSDSTFLMFLGEHSGVMQQAGIPLDQVINEGNHRVWRQPVDEQGLWERALADPAAYANFVVGFEGDPAWRAATQHGLTELAEIHTSGQAAAVVFQGRTR